MSTQSVAEQLVAMCRQGQNADAINQLYADNCTSREMPGAPNELSEGKAAILQKNQDFFQSLDEMHGSSVSDPVVAGNHFTVKMGFDATFKDQGRMQMEEVAVYEVQNDQIVGEQFFYSMPGQ